MGGTDNIENPGPYLHRSSKKAPRLGVLSAPPSFKIPASGTPLPPLASEGRPMSRDEAVQAYAARLDALKEIDAIVEEVSPEVSFPGSPAAAATDPLDPDSPDKLSLIPYLPSRSGPFQTITVPLYPDQVVPEDGEARTPRWRGG